MAVHLRETRPTWQVRIIEVSPQKCFELLLADQADIAVVVATAELPSTDDPRFELSQLLVDPLDLLLPQGHPLASNTHVRLADLVDEPWIMDTPGRPYHQLLQTACAAAGFTPAVAHYASEWDTGAALVAAGLGIALIPRLAHLPVGYPVERVSLSGDPASSRRIVTAIRRGSKTNPPSPQPSTPSTRSRRTWNPATPAPSSTSGLIALPRGSTLRASTQHRYPPIRSFVQKVPGHNTRSATSSVGR